MSWMKASIAGRAKGIELTHRIWEQQLQPLEMEGVGLSARWTQG